MSQTSGMGILNDAVKGLHLAWRRCQSSWSDQTADRFEKEFIDPVEGAARQSNDAMERLKLICEEARRACE
jgi:hypothetical protein